jgi:hypothetical protein
MKTDWQDISTAPTDGTRILVRWKQETCTGKYGEPSIKMWDYTVMYWDSEYDWQLTQTGSHAGDADPDYSPEEWLPIPQ